MKLKSLLSNRIQASFLVFLITLAFILWEYINGGVVTHHLLARDDMPGLSNWWGLFTLPLVFWLGISLIKRRQDKNGTDAADDFEGIVWKRFLAALAFGVLMSLLWEFKFGDLLQYLILIPLLLAFFIPVYLPEFLMGFVLGMAFTFGGILPVIFGLVLLVISFVINKIMGLIRSLIASKAA